jgi:hypothetical protein
MLVTGVITGDRNQRLTLDGVHVKLSRATIEFDQTIDARPNQTGIFNLQNVMPTARYDVLVQPLPPDMYVKSITSGGRNILQGNASLLPQPLQITLATATNSIDVHVTKGNDPAAGAEVVLIPDVLMQRRPDRYITGYTDESGDVQLTAVPPGRYTAYAFEKIEAGAYYVFAYDPPAANRFRDRSVTVIVGESGAKEIQLRVIPAPETAGGLQ